MSNKMLLQEHIPENEREAFQFQLQDCAVGGTLYDSPEEIFAAGWIARSEYKDPTSFEVAWSKALKKLKQKGIGGLGQLAFREAAEGLYQAAIAHASKQKEGERP